MARRSFLVALLGAVALAVGCGGPIQPRRAGSAASRRSGRRRPRARSWRTARRRTAPRPRSSACTRATWARRRARGREARRRRAPRRRRGGQGRGRRPRPARSPGARRATGPPGDERAARAAPSSSWTPRQAGRRAGGRAVKGILQIALGIIAAIGGFLDIGDLVFNSQAGATLRLRSCCGRSRSACSGSCSSPRCAAASSAVAKKPNFVLVKRALRPAAGDCHADRLAGAHRADAGGRARRRRLRAELLLRRQRADFFMLVAAAGHRRGRRASCRSAAIERIFGYGGLRCWSSSPRRATRPRLGRVGHGFVPESQSSRSTGTSSSA